MTQLTHFENGRIEWLRSLLMELDAKLLNALTMKNIADAAVSASLATRGEVEQLMESLHACASSVARRIQVWARKP
jgi:hypothetical protein